MELSPRDSDTRFTETADATDDPRTQRSSRPRYSSSTSRHLAFLDTIIQRLGTSLTAAIAATVAASIATPLTAPVALTTYALLALLASPAQAESPVVRPAARIVKTEIPDDELTGRDIYKRILDNRFETFIQTSKLISGDRAGNVQYTSLEMWFEDFRNENDEPEDGVTLSKTLVRYLTPFDLRHTGYLVIANLDRTNDQWMYLNSSRTVRRVNLRGEAVFGTDFSFEDVIPKELEQATYERLADELIQDEGCFVIDATPTAEARSQYSKIRVWIEKKRPVVLRTHYWDNKEVRIKELEVDANAIELQRGVWIPKHMTMTHLKMDSVTTLEVSEIMGNVVHNRSQFDLSRLNGH